MSEPLRWTQDLLASYSIAESTATTISYLILSAAVLCLSFLANFIVKKILLGWIRILVDKTEHEWDDALHEQKVFERFAHIAPAVVIYLCTPLVFPALESVQGAIQRVVIAYMVVIVCISVSGFLNAVVAIYRKFEVSRNRPIKSYVQVVKILVYLVAAILTVATLTDRSPWGFLSGLGALTAIILLVFKDTILGLVSSIQLTANDMVRIGDWIEVPKYGADGDVLDISLNTVKVQNWDKTISTIPTYALMSDTFKNWRGMNESGGRRIKRAVYLDMNSVLFCTDEMVSRFQRFEILRDYLNERLSEIERFNQDRNVDISEIVNGRRITNIGTFRAYVIAYLRHRPDIHQEGMTFLIRQLAPSEKGVGIEIYVFCKDQRWVEYEGIQADIFDHLLAVIPEFGLRVFQNPTGADLREAVQQNQ